MKTIISFLFLLFVLVSFDSYSQQISVLSNPLFNGPECIIFDEENNRYIVGNANNGKLLVVDSLKNVSVFKDNVGASVIMDFVIIGDSLLISANQPPSLICINKNTGDPIYQLNLNNIADACSQMVFDDRTGYLYMAEQYGSILKADINNNTCYVFASAGIPQGATTVELDTTENRLILFLWSSPVVKYISLADSTEIYNGPSIGTTQNAGSMMDTEGNIYISSWTGNKVMKAHINSLGEVSIFCNSSLNKPVGIANNPQINEFAVCNFGNHTLTLIQPDTITGIKPVIKNDLKEIKTIFNSSEKELKILFNANAGENFEVNIIDMKGRVRITKTYKAINIGQNSIQINTIGLEKGMCISQIKNVSCSYDIIEKFIIW